MTAYDYAKAMADAVAADSALATWISTAFPGKSLTTILGGDPGDPPGKRDAPSVQFLPLGQTTGDVAERQFQVLVVLGVSAPYRDTNTPGRVEYPAMGLLWAGYPLVLAACRDAVAVGAFGPLESEITMPEPGYAELGCTITLTTAWLAGSSIL